MAYFDQQFWGPEFFQPETDLRERRVTAVRKIMRFHQAADHGPIFVALSFLSLQEVGQRKDFALRVIWQLDGNPPPPEFFKRIHPAHFRHQIQANAQSFRMLAPKMDRMATMKIRDF